MGSLYKQSGSRIWWVKYHIHGRPVRESTGTADEQQAKQFLKKQEGQVAARQPLLPRLDRIRYEEVVKDLLGHYEATGTRDLKEFRRRVEHLDRFFGGWHIGAIGQPEVDAYVGTRRRKGAAGGTIRRELGTLTKMLRLAYQNGKLARLPMFQKPKEAAPRVLRVAAVRGRAPAARAGSASRGHCGVHVRMADAERSARPRASASRSRSRDVAARSRHGEE